MSNRERFKARRSDPAGSVRAGPSNRYPEPVCISSETFGSATNTSTSKAGRLQPAPFSRAGIAPAGPFSRRSEDQVPVGGGPLARLRERLRTADRGRSSNPAFCIRKRVVDQPGMSPRVDPFAIGRNREVKPTRGCARYAVIGNNPIAAELVSSHHRLRG